MKPVCKQIIGLLFYLQLNLGLYAQNNDFIWEKVSDFNAGKIEGAVAFSVGSKVYVCTGNDGIQNKKECWQYDPKENTWKKMSDFPGEPRCEAVAFTIGDRAYLGTGLVGPGNVKTEMKEMKDLWEYNPTKDSWTKKAEIPDGERFGAIGFSIDGKGYIGLGAKKGVLNCYNDIWEYNPQKNQWTKKGDFPEKGRTDACVFVIKDKAFVLLGKKLMEMTTSQKSMWEFSPKKNHWQNKADFPGPPRVEATAFSLKNSGYVFNGNNGLNVIYKDFWEYDVKSNKWNQKQDVISGERSNAIASVTDSTAYIGTGKSQNRILGITFSGLNDFWTIKMDTRTRVDYSAKLLYQNNNQNAPLAQQGVSLFAEEKVIQTAMTNEKGEFSFAKVDVEGKYKVVLEKNEKLPANAVIALAKPNGTITQKLGNKDGLFEYELSKLNLLDEEDDDTFFNLEYFIHSSDIEITIRTNIYYPSASWELLPEGIGMIDKVIKALNQYPNLILEISSHTDARGDDDSNMELSEKRAQEVVNYIVANSINIVADGIDSKRISGQGLGESKIINKCKNDVNCTEEEHKENRRTEFKFIKHK